MSLKPWQMWAAVGWGILLLALVVLVLAGVVSSSVLWPFTIVGGLFAGVNALVDYRARQRILSQDIDQ